jgi:hypothetical protein
MVHSHTTTKSDSMTRETDLSSFVAEMTARNLPPLPRKQKSVYFRLFLLTGSGSAPGISGLGKQKRMLFFV